MVSYGASAKAWYIQNARRGANADEMTPLVSVLFISYKRVHLLERTLSTFYRNTRYPKLELVITDDGSPEEIQGRIRKLPAHKFLLSPRNRGMGANANAGVKECTGKYVLFLQDDWECKGPCDYLERAVAVMEERKDVGLIRFYGVHQETLELCDCLSSENAFLVLPYNPRRGACPTRLYSDTPHLISRECLEHLGPRRERCSLEECELDYQQKFFQQGRFLAGFFPQYNNRTFTHIGEMESFRTKTLKHRVDRLLVPVADQLKRRSKRLYVMGKFVYRLAAKVKPWTR